jgi:hypothetical protein
MIQAVTVVLQEGVINGVATEHDVNVSLLLHANASEGSDHSIFQPLVLAALEAFEQTAISAVLGVAEDDHLGASLRGPV